MFQTPATSNLTEFRTAHEWRLRNLIEISFSNNIFHLSGQLELSRAGRRCLDVCMGKFIVGLKLMVARGIPPSRWVRWKIASRRCYGTAGRDAKDYNGVKQSFHFLMHEGGSAGC